jgi:hypothetical protein
VRRRFEERFGAARMAKDYVATYRKLLRKPATKDEGQSTWPRQLNLINGNGLIPHVD